MDLYRENILDHYKHPRNFGNLQGADVKSEEINVSCGDRIVIEVALKVTGKPQSNRGKKVTVIDAIRFSGEGCAINQASASMLTEKAIGMSVERVMKLDLAYVEKLLGTTLTPSRVKCAMLPLEAIQKAVSSSI